MKLIRISILLLNFILVACTSNKPKLPKTQDFFTTFITQDGAKQFNYTLTMEMPGAGTHDGGSEHGGHGNGMHGDRNSSDDNQKDRTGKGVFDHLNSLFEDGLSAKLSNLHFCREGFKELDKKTERGVIQMNGECNDLANNEDKIRFPNPPPREIKEEIIN